jgi:hypothetical protein
VGERERGKGRKREKRGEGKSKTAGKIKRGEARPRKNTKKK